MRQQDLELWQDLIAVDRHQSVATHSHIYTHAYAHTGRYFDSGDAFSGAGKKEDPLESAVEKRETLAVVQGQLDSESSEAAKEAAEVARKNAAAEAAFKKKFGDVKPSAGALLHRQRKHEVSYPACLFLVVLICVFARYILKAKRNSCECAAALELLRLLLLPAVAIVVCQMQLLRLSKMQRRDTLIQVKHSPV